jgi:DNA polymerase-3 subunit alpha
MLAAMDQALKMAEQQARDVSSGMTDLFGGAMVESKQQNPYASSLNTKPFTIRERLGGEKDTLGLYLTGHPIDEYEDELKYMLPQRIVDLRSDKEKTTVYGMVVGMRVLKNKRGDSFAFITLDDKSGRLELSVWADQFDMYRSILNKDALLVVKGAVSEDSFTGGLKMVAESVQSIYEARCSKLEKLRISVSKSDIGNGWVKDFESSLGEYKDGSCPIVLEYSHPTAAGQFSLGDQWRVHPKDELITRLKDQFGSTNVNLDYG